MKNWQYGWAVMLALVLATASCRRDIYDEDELRKATETMMTVDSIDKNHTWELVESEFVSVDVSNVKIGTERAQVWSANALNGEKTTILGELCLSDGEVRNIFYTTLPTQGNVYVALKDTAGTYTVQQVPTGQFVVNFNNPIARKAKVDENLLSRMTYTYCFEDYTEFLSLRSDYDYNDIVLRVSLEAVSARQVRLDVTLAAVGTLNQVAAALRLMGLKYESVESVTTVDNESFDKGLSKNDASMIKESGLLIRGRLGEAVINLFEDAHWATDEAESSSNGVLERYYYNVAKLPGGDHKLFAPRTVSYIITVKEAASLSVISFSRLDPFMLAADLSGFYEMHPAVENRHACVLRNYIVSDAVVGMPWALAIPSGTFRYPLEGTNIGFFKNGALFGAYMTEGHSFGEWAADRKKATDWYLYPTGNQVY